MLFLKQLLILPFLCHKSEITCQIDSNKVLNSKLKLDLYNRVKAEIIEFTVPPQKLHNFWDDLYAWQIPSIVGEMKC